ncbi:hypothetical protein [Paraherbaspirillum soli]|uniref:Regulatory protein, RpfE type n=1 Tax=Paraherbaspirillum soli TaxID=631222 RepID=A0ABW0MAS1_9BURK
MIHIDILLPFGLPPPELARDVLRDLKVPALATLLARSNCKRQTFDEFARALPHEAWLASQAGLPASAPSDSEHQSSPPIAVAAMRALGLSVDQGIWFMLHPAHIHVARDHLVLTDLRQVNLTDADARQLFDVAIPLFEEAGRSLVYGNANTWFMRADDWHDLRTSTPDATCGHNIDIWMPQGEGERAWRKLQNEVQMAWFTHPLNQQREARGLQSVNSLWLWGGSAAAPLPSTGQATYREVFSPAGMSSGWLAAFGQFAATAVADCRAGDIVSAAPQHGLLILDQLIQPALTAEWSSWLQQLRTLESDWFAPLLQALQSGKLDRLSLVFTDNTRITASTASRLSLKKFWVKPALTGLLS